MKTYRVSLTFMTAFVLLIVSPFLTARGTASAPVAAKDLSIAAHGVLVRAHNARTSAGVSSNFSPLTLRELALARRGTAKYHDIANALADGYVDGNLYTPGEGTITSTLCWSTDTSTPRNRKCCSMPRVLVKTV